MSAKRKLIVFTPCGARSTDSDHTMAKWGGLQRYFYAKERYRDLTIAIHEQGGLGLDRMRNLACAHALADPLQPDLLFVDRDIVLRPADIEAMYLSPFDVVGVAYPFKEIRWDEVANAVKMGLPTAMLPFVASSVCASISEDALDGKLSTRTEHGEFLEVETIGTGLLLIRHHVLVRYRDYYRERIEYRTDPAFDMGQEKMWLIFQCARDPDDDSPTGGYLSEDYFFCKMWRRMGGKVHCYADAQVKHWGQHCYQSNLSLQLRIHRAHKEAQKVAATPKLALPGTSDFDKTLKEKGLSR